MTTQEKVMTTQEVANRLVELCRKSDVLQAQEELFADNVSSIEPAGSPTPVVNSKAAVLEKGKQFAAIIEEVHGNEISDPVVAGNRFAVSWMFDVTMKGQGRQKMEEICLYDVKDGKIVSEQFFM
ncbi:MAG: hypothetical protein JWO03_3976 [Bacteroidetes bacterium]|nr:hypothetical protein [Bacteroidota bacterium]